MSDMMRPLSFHRLMTQTLDEYKKTQTIYGVKNIYRAADDGELLNIFGETLEVPFGAAAGPNTQLAQNIVACYAGGCRFFELKTVQTLDGTNLHVDKPCIRAVDECYNVEWSTELFVEQARDEYIKAWYALKLISKELDLGSTTGFIFNMSCGYDYEGITSAKIDGFLEAMRDASGQEQWKACEEWALSHLDQFENVDEEYIRSISAHVCGSITLSTLHGCPASEIEKIAAHLIDVKNFHTYVKCNPTLLGYQFVRDLLDDMGYKYITFDDHNFVHDLQYEAAVPMIGRLRDLAEKKGLQFGVKLSNTFPVTIAQGDLPGENMYMSGKALYPLTINLAKRLSADFDGKLNISFSGGADRNNIGQIFESGIWPITVCTVLLKPNGMEAAKPLADILSKMPYPADQTVDNEKLAALADGVRTDKRYCKSAAALKKQEKIDGWETPHGDTLTCRVLCGSCVRVCPNRANVIVEAPESKYIVHIDSFCNECGNCKVFCVEPCYPYQDRVTFFDNEPDFEDSNNTGFLPLPDGQVRYRYNGQVGSGSWDDMPAELKGAAEALREQHPWYFA